jgi:hypothetical protein
VTETKFIIEEALSNGSMIAGKDIWRTSAVMPSVPHDVDILRLFTADESSEWVIGKRSSEVDVKADDTASLVSMCKARGLRMKKCKTKNFS